MRHNYNKLVRDRIPEIIQTSGKRCSVEITGGRRNRVYRADEILAILEG